MPKTWGIYRGFNPHTNPLNKWVEPVCENCNSNLQPWIDWVSHGSVGYCKKCNEFSVVKSEWIPSPHVHSKAEIGELVKHEVKKVEFDQTIIKNKYLWDCHENIPLSYTITEELDNYRRNLRTKTDNKNKLSEHLIWSLIFNSNSFNKSLIPEYIEFVLYNPHYFKIYDTYTLWIGHEIDIVNKLEKTFKKELTESIFNIWSLKKDEFTIHEYKMRIGFYVPKDVSQQKKYGIDFLNFATKIKRRIF